MRFERIRPGEYLAKIEGSREIYIWVFRKDYRRLWWWCMGGYGDGDSVWETDNYGPFSSRKAAIAEAIANHEYFLTN